MFHLRALVATVGLGEYAYRPLDLVLGAEDCHSLVVLERNKSGANEGLRSNMVRFTGHGDVPGEDHFCEYPHRPLGS